MRRPLACGDGGVVTVAASIRGLGVIKRQDHRRPHIGGMACVALFASHRMGGRLISARTDTIVTTSTITGLPRYRGMIKENLQPIGGVVAHLARFRGRDVRRAFTGGDGAVVAVLTHISGLAVV